jgi:hypothetical protein
VINAEADVDASGGPEGLHTIEVTSGQSGSVSSSTQWGSGMMAPTAGATSTATSALNSASYAGVASEVHPGYFTTTGTVTSGGDSSAYGTTATGAVSGYSATIDGEATSTSTLDADAYYDNFTSDNTTHGTTNGADATAENGAIARFSTDLTRIETSGNRQMLAKGDLATTADNGSGGSSGSLSSYVTVDNSTTLSLTALGSANASGTTGHETSVRFGGTSTVNRFMLDMGAASSDPDPSMSGLAIRVNGANGSAGNLKLFVYEDSNVDGTPDGAPLVQYEAQVTISGGAVTVPTDTLPAGHSINPTFGTVTFNSFTYNFDRVALGIPTSSHILFAVEVSGKSMTDSFVSSGVTSARLNFSASMTKV